MSQPPPRNSSSSNNKNNNNNNNINNNNNNNNNNDNNNSTTNSDFRQNDLFNHHQHQQSEQQSQQHQQSEQQSQHQHQHQQHQHQQHQHQQNQHQHLPPPHPGQSFSTLSVLTNPTYNSYSTTTSTSSANVNNSTSSFNEPRFFPQSYQFQSQHPLQIPQPLFNNQNLAHQISNTPINPNPVYQQPQQPQPQPQQQQVFSRSSFIHSDPSQPSQYTPSGTTEVLSPHGTSLPDKLQRVLPLPPLSKAPVRPDSLQPQIPRRSRRRSKYTKEQDEMIVSMKKGGKSWVDIAEVTGVGSFLAARNRYQVLIGQQGGGSASWGMDDNTTLQDLLDEGEIEKWSFIAKELQKATGKNFTDKQCREVIKILFWKDPQSFGINDDTLMECIKEHNITVRSIQEQQEHQNFPHNQHPSSSLTQQQQFISPQFSESQPQHLGEFSPPVLSIPHPNSTSDYLATYYPDPNLPFNPAQQPVPHPPRGHQSSPNQFQSSSESVYPLAPLNFGSQTGSSTDLKKGGRF